MQQYSQVIETPLGKMTLLSDDNALLGSWFENQKHFGGKYDLTQAIDNETPVLRQAKKWLADYFAGKQPLLTMPIKLHVTSFQEQVLHTLQQIDYGQTVTYKDICQQLTTDEVYAKHLSRAVGHAIGTNPLSIFLPCHRVLGSNGLLTGYAGGIDRKRALLALEQGTL